MRKTTKSPGEKIVKEIKRATRKHYSSEEKIRIVLDGLRGEDSIAELCRREGISQGIYYKRSKDFMEAGKKRLAGDTARAANTDEVKELRREAKDLKEVVAEQTLELRLLKKSMLDGGGDHVLSQVQLKQVPMPEVDAANIAALNDQARQTFMECRVVITQDVQAIENMADILGKVRWYDRFTPDNDPYGEHDFGSFRCAGETIFWKWDYYDVDMGIHSPDPSDTTVTTRVLTIMLADEY